MHQLMTRDLTGYDARSRAPATSAKATMTAEASSDIEQWMMEHAENAPLCYPLVTVAEIIDKLPRDLQGKRARNEVRDVLRRKFDGIANKDPIRPDGKKGDAVRVWDARLRFATDRDDALFKMRLFRSIIFLTRAAMAAGVSLAS
jgi:hypothetical protein